jgi:hypothetical protein
MYDTLAPIDLSQVSTYPIAERHNKVRVADFAQVCKPDGTVRDFLASLPHILAGEDFPAVVQAIVHAVKVDKPVMWGMGAHVVKCGLNSWIIELMQHGIIRSIAMNGAGPIHDFEIALIGETSEDVASGLVNGTFGMVTETGEWMNAALDRDEVRTGQMGMGEALGRKLVEMQPPYIAHSILANAFQLGIPVTVHVALGTDIIHMQDNQAGALLGQASFTDFRLFTAMVARLSGGGVYLNIGSAVILPEVFLKAFTIAQNVGAELKEFVTVNLDMQQHYRPRQNVVGRPAEVGGRGYALTGQHELMIPLLAWAVLNAMAGGESQASVG